MTFKVGDKVRFKDTEVHQRYKHTQGIVGDSFEVISAKGAGGTVCIKGIDPYDHGVFPERLELVSLDLASLKVGDKVRVVKDHGGSKPSGYLEAVGRVSDTVDRDGDVYVRFDNGRGAYFGKGVGGELELAGEVKPYQPDPIVTDTKESPKEMYYVYDPDDMDMVSFSTLEEANAQALEWADEFDTHALVLKLVAKAVPPAPATATLVTL